MFGSMLEYVLRSYTNEGSPVVADIRSDGSMHSFDKRYHPVTIQQILDEFDHEADITTPIYPCIGGELADIVESFRLRSKTWNQDHKILISSPNQAWTEINILFHYHKTFLRGSPGLEIYAKQNPPMASKWNTNYSDWSQMHVWEMREWFSLFYRKWSESWIVSEIDEDFLHITNQDLMQDTKKTVQKILSWCNLTPKPGLDKFIDEYVSKQTYILDEYNKIENAVDCVVNNRDYHWDRLSPVGEAMIQTKLRDHGLEIQCHGLDTFPTSSVELKKLTYPSINLHTIQS